MIARQPALIEKAGGSTRSSAIFTKRCPRHLPAEAAYEISWSAHSTNCAAAFEDVCISGSAIVWFCEVTLPPSLVGSTRADNEKVG